MDEIDKMKANGGHKTRREESCGRNLFKCGYISMN